MHTIHMNEGVGAMVSLPRGDLQNMPSGFRTVVIFNTAAEINATCNKMARDVAPALQYGVNHTWFTHDVDE